jgi:uncharacterized membrane protein YdjX (TVP38/TMEM64 family)
VSLRSILRGFLMIAILVLVGLGLEHFDFAHLLDTGWVDGHVRGQGATGIALFVLVAAATIACGLPRQIACFLAGYIAGLAEGTVLAMVASLLGCAAAFLFARVIARDFVRRRLGTRVHRIDDFLGRNPVVAATLIRLLPVGSNLLTNLIAGVSAVPPAGFLVGSAIGFLPQTVVFVLLGSGIRVDPPLRIAVSAALFVASGLLGVVLYRRLRAEASGAGPLEGESGPQ